MAPNPFDIGEDDVQLWRWLTTGGTANANDTPPTVKTQGTTTTNTAGTATHTADATVDSTAGGVTLLASNANRKAAFVQNVGTANIRVSVGGTPATTTGLQLTPGATLILEAPFCPTAAIKAIRETSTSSTAAVMEIA